MMAISQILCRQYHRHTWDKIWVRSEKQSFLSDETTE